jgi:hypothetical protein
MSVTVIRIGVHLAAEKSNQHVVCLASRVSHMTTVHEVPTKLKLGPCSWDEVLPPSDHSARPSSWAASFSLQQTTSRSREGRFDVVLTRLLGLLGPINPIYSQYKSNPVYRGQNDIVLNRHGRRLPTWNLRIATALSPSFPSE